MENGVVIHFNFVSKDGSVSSCSGSGFTTGPIILTTGSWCIDLLRSSINNGIPSVRWSTDIVQCATIYFNYNTTELSSCKVEVVLLEDLFQILKTAQSNDITFDSLHHIIAHSTLIMLYPSEPVINQCSPFPLLMIQEEERESVLYSISSPFGHRFTHFCLNSLSHGHIIKRYKQYLLLVDIPLVTGCEGGMVMTKNKGNNKLNFLGMIISVKDGGSLVVSREIIKSYIHFETRYQLQRIPLLSGNNSLPITVPLYKSVVSLLCDGITYGNGIVLTPTVILTCAHVIKGKSSIKVTSHDNTTSLCSGNILYTSSDVYPDIGLIELTHSLTNVVSLLYLSTPQQPLLCTDVNAVGYGTHNECHITNGIVSKLVTSNDRIGLLLLIQSNAPVYNGMSGGLLIDNNNCQPLGMLQCNIRDDSNGKIYPFVNFSIPFSLIIEPIRSFLQDRDSAKLRRFEQMISSINVHSKL